MCGVQSRCWRFVAAAVGMMLLSGCAGKNLLHWNEQELIQADAANPVVQILCLWQPAEGRGVDGLPARGFAGQVFFFTRGTPAPAQVDGDVRIYLFDDQGPRAEQAKPIHQYDFIDGAWNAYRAETMMGPAYQLFVPYTRKGAHQARCSLRLRLTPSDGPATYSDMVNVVLAGTTDDSESASQSPGNPSAAADSALTAQPPPMGASIRQMTVRFPTVRNADASLPADPGTRTALLRRTAALRLDNLRETEVSLTTPHDRPARHPLFDDAHDASPAQSERDGSVSRRHPLAEQQAGEGSRGSDRTRLSPSRPGRHPLGEEAAVAADGTSQTRSSEPPVRSKLESVTIRLPH